MGSAMGGNRGTFCALLAARLLVDGGASVGGGGGSGSATQPQATDERKISVVTALLPPTGTGNRTARLRIEAFGGCYEWESKRPDLVKVEMPELLERHAQTLECLERKALECMDRGPVLQQELFGAGADEAEASCQPVAVLRSVGSTASPRKVLIAARDVGSPGAPELQSEVYVAPVARVEVETRVRRINVQDYDAVTARAYDAQGNVFSSLEGLEFQWSISHQAVLRSPALVDSVFKLSPARRALAQAGLQSDMLLLYGVATGRASVSVQLLGMPGGPLQSPEVMLTVSESIFAIPRAVRVPPMAHLQMRLKVARGPIKPLSQVPEVILPVAHFKWQTRVHDGSPADTLFVRPDTAHIVSQRVGSSYVVVEDTRIENNSDEALVQVAEPAELRLSPVPLADGLDVDARWHDLRQRYSDDWAEALPAEGTSWYLVRGRTYVLRLDMLDYTAQGGVGHIYIPPNFRVTALCAVQGAPTQPAPGKPDAGNGRAPPAQGGAAACPLHVIDQTPNSALLLVRAETLGTGHYDYSDARAEADEDDRGRGFDMLRWPKLQVHQEFHVVEPLRLLSSFSGPMVLPPWHSHLLRVGGGSGAFTFALRGANPAGCVSVSDDGRVQAEGQIGDATLVVSDMRNSANNLTLRLLVRRVGGLVLRPPQLQIQLHQDTSEPVPVPIFARPEASGPGDGADPLWSRLRFWNCSALSTDLLQEMGFGPDAISAASSDTSVAEASIPSAAAADAAPGNEGACGAVSVRPLSEGKFSLEASVRRPAGPQSILAAGTGDSLRATVDLRVYTPLSVTFEGASFTPSSAEVSVSPCSSSTLRLSGGPAPMEVPGRTFQNLTDPLEGTHLRLQKLPGSGAPAFTVLCLQPSPGPVRLVAEVRHEPDDREVHGGAVVARAYAWIRCATPHSVKIVLASSPLASGIMDDGSGKNIRRGVAHQFRADFYDEGGAVIASASEYTPGWSLEGNPQAPLWLKADGPLAAVTLPAATPQGDEVVLRVLASKPDGARCKKGRSLEPQHEAALLGWARDIAKPLTGELRLRAAPPLRLSWPGYPSQHFAFAPKWAWGFAASHGSGAASLALHAGLADIVGLDSLCDGAAGAGSTDADACVMPVCVPNASGSAKNWFVQPQVPGQVQVIVSDADLLGAAPEVLDLSFLPASRITLQLVDPDGAPGRPTARLIVRGQAYRLSVEVRDTVGQVLSAANWRPLRLEVSANDSRIVLRPRLGMEAMSCGERLEADGTGSFDVVGTASGTFEVRARAWNFQDDIPVYSNTLLVHVFEPFGIAPARPVMLPGQTFEFTVNGGPSLAVAGGARVEFSSSDPAVAGVGQGSGLLTALRPGRADVSARLLESETGRELFAQARAEVVVASPVRVLIHHLELGRPADAPSVAPFTVLRGSREPIRLAALLQASQGMEFTLPLTAAPVGAAEDLRDIGRACSFRWSTSDALLVLSATSVGASPSAAGAAVVDVRADGVGAIDAAAEVTVSVEVSCPGTAALRASATVRVSEPLYLVSPRPLPGAQGVAVLRAPPLGRLPLAFSRPREHLRLEVVGSAAGEAGGGVVAKLPDSETGSVELVLGSVAGQALVSVHDVRSEGMEPPLLITVAVRAPRAARLVPRLPQRLVLGAVAESVLMLADDSGELLSLPKSFNFSVSSSHPSVLVAEATTAVGGDPVLRLRGSRPGCAAASVVVEVPTASGEVLYFTDVASVCVSPGALSAVPRPLLVWPGAAARLSAEGAVLGSGERRTVALTARLACLPGAHAGLASVAARVAPELASLLRLPASAVWVAGTRWASPDEASPPGCEVAGMDVDIEFSAEALPPLMGLEKLLEPLWFPESPDHLGAALGLLDRSRGVRAAPGAALGAACPCCSSCRSSGEPPAVVAPDLCAAGADGSGWTSSDQTVLEVSDNGAGEHLATALRPGRAVARLCHGGVSLELDVVVEKIAEIRLEAPLGGALLTVNRGDGQATVLSNRPGALLVLPARLFAGAVELRSGPFLEQGVSFHCAPEDASLREFFDFRPWSIANTTLGKDSAASLETARLMLPEMAHGGPQVACVLFPRRLDPKRWVSRPSPQSLEAQVFVAAAEAGAAFASRKWAFVPQFEVMCPSGDNATGGVCAVLSVHGRTATIWVWTGGHPVEGSIVSQLQDSRRGSVSMRVGSEPQGSMEAAPTTSVRLAWEGQWAWGGVEDVSLRLESRASGQVEVLRVLVDGSGLDPGRLASTPATPPPALEASGQFGAAAPVALVAALALALLAYCLGCSGRMSRGGDQDDGPAAQLWGASFVPAAPTPAARAGFAVPGALPSAGGVPGIRHPLGATPFYPVAAG